MGRTFIAVLILAMLVLASIGCAANRRYNSELRGLMIQDNLKLPRNREYYSKHNIKARKEADHKFRKNSRLYVFQKR